MSKLSNFNILYLEFFFNLSEKIDAFIGTTKYQNQNLKPKEIIEIELEKLEVIYNDTGENSLEIILSLCFGFFICV